jgi:hypothetical protein
MPLTLGPVVSQVYARDITGAPARVYYAVQLVIGRKSFGYEYFSAGGFLRLSVVNN